MSTFEPVLRPAAQRLLRRVAVRQELAALGKRLHLFFFLSAGVYCLLFVSSRLLGLLPDCFEPLTLLLLPAAALALGVVFHHRPSQTDVARLVDTRAEAKDLFLTAALLRRAPGEFKPIVLAQAEEKAATIVPSKVVPYRWEGRARDMLVALAALLVAILFLPQLDPFGQGKKRQDEAKRRQLLAETHKATELRLAALKKSDPKAAVSEEAKQAVEDLKHTLNQMKPTDKQGNLQRLTDAQKDLGGLWKKRSEERLKDAFSRAPDSQRVGASEGQKAERWKRSLQRGDASEVKKEMAEIKEQARKLQQLPESAEKKKAQQELQQRLKNLSDFLANNASSKTLEDAVNRALEQLTMAGEKGLSKDAMKALQESLDLTDMEMDALAQAIRDLESLEAGMKVAQLARQLNALKGLDGKGTDGLKDINDYEEFYKKLLGGDGGPTDGKG